MLVRLYSSMVEHLTFNQLVTGSSPVRVIAAQSQKVCKNMTVAVDLVLIKKINFQKGGWQSG